MNDAKYFGREGKKQQFRKKKISLFKKVVSFVLIVGVDVVKKQIKKRPLSVSSVFKVYLQIYLQIHHNKYLLSSRDF